MLQRLGLELPDDHSDGFLCVHFLAPDAGYGQESFPWSSSSVSTEAQGGMGWCSQNGRRSRGRVRSRTGSPTPNICLVLRPDCCGSPSKGLGARGITPSYGWSLKCPSQTVTLPLWREKAGDQSARGKWKPSRLRGQEFILIGPIEVYMLPKKS